MAEVATNAIRSPFYQAQAALGASFMEYAGWYWTNGFGDLRAEYEAVRGDLGVWDVSPLNKWELRGADAMRAAARLHSNDIRGMKVGQVHYGAFCDRDGRLVDDGTVFKFSDEHFWVMTNGRDHEAHFAEVMSGLSATIKYIGRELPHLGLQGPRARDALAAICNADIRKLPYFHFIPEPVQVGGVDCWVSRTGFGGELGYELFCAVDNAERLWGVVTERCRAMPFGVEAIEVLRIEAGLMILDYDYQAHERNPFDLSMDRQVAMDRADFYGKEALVSVAAKPPRRFKTLVMDSDEMPEYGSQVVKNGAPVGTLTSPTASPMFGSIGLAVLQSDVAADGEPLEVLIGEATVPAHVAPLAIYDPQKLRPRS